MSSIVPLRKSPFAVFRSPAFTLLWIGQFISTAGSALTYLAASILIYRVTGSALAVGLMLVATAAPSLVVGLLAGVVVDRFNHKGIMLSSDLTRAVISFLIPVFVLGLPVSIVARQGNAGPNIFWLYVLIIVSSAITQFFDPAFASVLPDLASEEEMAAATSLMLISSFGATAIGFAGSGLIAAVFPIQWAFYLDAVSFLASATCILLARIPRFTPDSTTTGEAVFSNLRAGASYLFNSPILRGFWLLGIPVSLATGLSNALLLPFAEKALHASVFVYGLQEGLTSVGFVVGSLLIAGVADRLRESELYLIALLGMGAATVLYAGTVQPAPAIGLMMLAGFFNALSPLASRLVVQRNTPRQYRGRVFSTFFVRSNVIAIVGMAAGGLADYFNLRVLFGISGVVLLISAVFVLVLPGVRLSRAEWRRASRMLRAAGTLPGRGIGRVPTMQNLEALSAVLPVFADVPLREQQLLLGQSQIYDVPAGTVVIRQGEPGTAAYFLLSGRVAVGNGSADHDIPIALLSVGDFFGEIAALTMMHRTANVVTEQASTLLEVPAAVMRELSQVPALNRLFLSTMTSRLAELHLIDLPGYTMLDQGMLADLRTPEHTATVSTSATVGTPPSRPS